jgi:hypothetical protein
MGFSTGSDQKRDFNGYGFKEKLTDTGLTGFSGLDRI